MQHVVLAVLMPDFAASPREGNRHGSETVREPRRKVVPTADRASTCCGRHVCAGTGIGAGTGTGCKVRRARTPKPSSLRC